MPKDVIEVLREKLVKDNDMSRTETVRDIEKSKDSHKDKQQEEVKNMAQAVDNLSMQYNGKKESDEASFKLFKKEKGTIQRRITNLIKKSKEERHYRKHSVFDILRNYEAIRYQMQQYQRVYDLCYKVTPSECQTDEKHKLDHCRAVVGEELDKIALHVATNKDEFMTSLMGNDEFTPASAVGKDAEHEDMEFFVPILGRMNSTLKQIIEEKEDNDIFIGAVNTNKESSPQPSDKEESPQSQDERKKKKKKEKSKQDKSTSFLYEISDTDKESDGEKRERKETQDNQEDFHLHHPIHPPPPETRIQTLSTTCMVKDNDNKGGDYHHNGEHLFK